MFSTNQHAGGIGVVLQSLEKDLIEYVVCLQFPMTNNEAEYEDVLTGLNLAKAAKASLVVIYSDSQVIVGHVNGDYEAKGEQMKKYLSMVKSRVNLNFLVKLMHILRGENEEVVCLAKAKSTKHVAFNSQVLSFIQHSPAIDKVDIQIIPIGDN